MTINSGVSSENQMQQRLSGGMLLRPVESIALIEPSSLHPTRISRQRNESQPLPEVPNLANFKKLFGGDEGVNYPSETPNDIVDCLLEPVIGVRNDLRSGKYFGREREDAKISFTKALDSLRMLDQLPDILASGNLNLTIRDIGEEGNIFSFSLAEGNFGRLGNDVVYAIEVGVVRRGSNKNIKQIKFRIVGSNREELKCLRVDLLAEKKPIAGKPGEEIEVQLDAEIGGGPKTDRKHTILTSLTDCGDPLAAFDSLQDRLLINLFGQRNTRPLRMTRQDRGKLTEILARSSMKTVNKELEHYLDMGQLASLGVPVFSSVENIQRWLLGDSSPNRRKALEIGVQNIARIHTQGFQEVPELLAIWEQAVGHYGSDIDQQLLTQLEQLLELKFLMDHSHTKK